jgi:hypothetical protein
MSFKFESLRIWQISMELGEEINSIAFDFRKVNYITYHRNFEDLLIL